VSSAHKAITTTHVSIRQDLEEDRWITNLNEDRKRFYLVATLLDPHTKFLTFCDDKHFPWKHEGNGFLAMDFKGFYGEIRMYQSINLVL